MIGVRVTGVLVLLALIVLGGALQLDELVEAEDEGQAVERMPAALLTDDLKLDLLLGVAERRPQEEAVELRFG